MKTQHKKPEILLAQALELTLTDINRSQQLAKEAYTSVIPGMKDAKILTIRSNIIVAEWHRQMGQYAEAVVGFLSAIEDYQAFGNDEWLLLALYRLGMTYTIINYHTDAIKLHMRQYEIAKEMGNHEEMGNATRRLGLNYCELQQEDRTIAYYQESLKHFEMIDNETGIGGVYNNLALFYQAQGKIDLALDYARKSVALFQKADYLHDLTLGYGTLTGILIDAGHLKEAMPYAKSNLRLAKELKIYPTIIYAHLNMGKLHTHNLQFDTALRLYETALELAREHEDLMTQNICHEHLCDYYERLGNYQKALEHFRLHHQLRIQSLNHATKARFEMQAILHQTQQAQSDLIQQKLLREEEKLHYERLTQMKDELMSTASHDLKNPLATIQLMTYLLSRHLKDSDKRIHEIIQQINSSVEGMRNLIVNLLDLARMETGKPIELKMVGVTDYLQAIVDEFKIIVEQKNIVLIYEKSDDDFSMTIDSDQMQQVLRNLLSNACKYTPQGGTIRVSFKQDSYQTLLQISDTGIGVPEADLPHIFDRFYRVKDTAHQTEEGTGLGLAICKSIVERHNGSIAVESEVGKGTTFVVSLPFKDLASV
jgi:signal transduction histidine kinase